MQVFRLGKWLGLFCFSLVLWFSFAPAGTVEAQNCSAAGCHKTWLDNSVVKKDVNTDNATTDYLPLNLPPGGAATRPFYTIPEAYTGSVHGANAVECVGCHTSQSSAHAKNMVQTAKCEQCHGDLKAGFDVTRHSNPNSKPGKFFDQTGKGTGQAFASAGPLEPVIALFQANNAAVTKTQRIEECSVCHNYAMQYTNYKSNLGTDKLTPQVGCAACHDAHIPAPSEDVVVDSTVTVAAISGTTVLAVTPATGRSVTYREYKPYKLADNEAQDAKNGMWSRGTAFTRPNNTIVEGTVTISNGTATSDLLTFTAGGLVGKVQVHDTVFITGTATATGVGLPVDATAPGTVDVTATLDRTGFGVEEVIDDTHLRVSPGVVATATVTYTRATPPPATATFTVPIPFSGDYTFEVRNMNTNLETLCGSCHTKGDYKFTAYGKQGATKDTSLKSTHNNDILTQYKSAGHANILAPPWEEFSARPYGTSHNTYYPFDMSITGSGGSGSLRNKQDTVYDLASTVPSANAYLSVLNNRSLPRFVNNYACFQCHNGVGAIDYLQDRQGTAAAQVLWGDATVTCITCHDTHAQGAGANIRTPVYLSYNSRFTSATPTGKINKFMDGTDIPAGVGTGVICLFCHQGRESGLTVYKAILANANPAPLDPYTNPDRLISAAGVSFTNPHYLDSGAILWGRNAWEYFFGAPLVAQEYSEGIPAHQNLNCGGCHMGEASEDNAEGGHTWRPRVETCQTCHGTTVTAFTDIPAIGDYDGDGTVESAFEEIGTLDVANPANDTGLYGQLRAALAGQGIFYNPDAYPYFFSDAGFTTQFRLWTTNTLSAAFNLSWAFKSGNCVPYHNAWYGAQILQDSLVALGIDTTGYYRPDIFNRTATDYRLSPYIL